MPEQVTVLLPTLHGVVSATPRSTTPPVPKEVSRERSGFSCHMWKPVPSPGTRPTARNSPVRLRRITR